MITRFEGSNSFLSNFYTCPVEYEDRYYSSVEHAFQAAKTDNQLERERIQLTKTPGDAKRLGRQVALRKDWELVKVDVMRDLLRSKFQGGLVEKLLATYPKELVEGNLWHDNFWGVCYCEHCVLKDMPYKNWLGKLLMEVREELRNA